MSNDANMALLAQGAATQARIETNHAKQEADEARRRAMYAEAALSNATTDRDLEHRVAVLVSERDLFRLSAEHLQQQLDERGILLMEWMHSNEAFRRIAKQYGKKLGLTNETRQADYAEHLLNAAEEDPKFANTKLGKEAREKKLGI